jgi:Bacterial Ig-like domain
MIVILSEAKRSDSGVLRSRRISCHCQRFFDSVRFRFASPNSAQNDIGDLFGISLNKVRSSFLASSILLLSSYFLISCASQQPPPGGPVDTTRPHIDSVWPHQRETNVPIKPRIFFQFGQDMDEGTFSTAFTITPYLNGTPKFHWSGHDEVRVELPDSLRDSTTYTVQLSRDMKSRRANQLAAPFLLTFSTGPLIDTGMLSGYLLTPINAPPMKPSDLFIFAYDITNKQRADTLNFAHTPPDLLTQPNDQGVWQFLAMKTGHHYRVFAIGDVYRNKVYDAGVDSYGIPAGDAVLDSAVKSGMYIRMSPPTDTIKPELQDVEVVDSFHIRVHFSEAIDSMDVHAHNFILTGIPIVAAFRESPEHHASQFTLVTASPLAPNQKYILQGIRDSLHDLAHNPLSDSAYIDTFTTPTELRSATPPKFVAINVRDSARDISQLPSFLIIFNDVVNKDSIEHAITLTDTGHHAVSTVFRWYDDAKVYLRPADSLLSNIFYTITIREGSIRSPLASIPGVVKDTVLHFHFKTANERDFGIIQGTVMIADSFFAQHPKSALVVQVMQNGTVLTDQKILPHGEKSFEFDQIPTATYRVRAYLSMDGTGKYDPGAMQPWRYGVPSGEYGKAFDTRPRWATANIDFDVK